VLSTVDYDEPKKVRPESRATGGMASPPARAGVGIPRGVVAVAITVFCAAVWCAAIAMIMRVFQLI
jgi:hypothetical protein